MKVTVGDVTFEVHATPTAQKDAKLSQRMDEIIAMVDRTTAELTKVVERKIELEKEVNDIYALFFGPDSPALKVTTDPVTLVTRVDLVGSVRQVISKLTKLKAYVVEKGGYTPAEAEALMENLTESKPLH